MQRRRAVSIGVLFTTFSFLLFLTHYKLLSLPFFWDEAGQFISQAIDLMEKGLLIPVSAMPNSHPPGLMLLLAGVWMIFGYSIEVTRALMLLLGAAFLTASFLLAVELLRGARGAPAFFAIALLACNPLVYTQSMMAQLDLPSAVFSTILLLAYVLKLEALAVAAAVLSVLFKETSIAIPIVLGGFAWFEGRRQFALQLILAPILLVGNWLAYVWLSTGRLFGDTGYADYNIFYPLHPVRLGYALFRRISYLGLENLHFVPLAVLIWRWKQIGFDPLWKPVAAACAAHVLLVSAMGGAVLERYLLPVLPVLYISFAAGISTLSSMARNVVLAVSCMGLLTMLFINPPWPFALENNLAMVDMVEVHRDAANLLDTRLGTSRITTAWPLSDALKKPYLGYVNQPLPVVRLVEDFSLQRLRSMQWQKGDVLVLYQRAWDPAGNFMRWPFVTQFMKRFFQVPEDASLQEIKQIPWFKPLVGMERRGFWVEILVVD